MIHLFIFVIFLLNAGVVFTSKAAPIPTTSSSAMNSPNWNTVFSQMGFNLKLVSKEWTFINTSSESTSPNQEINLGLKSLSDTARLSLKIENLTTKTTVENYAKKFLRDYNQYGFEVLSSKNMTLNNSNVIVVDLIQKNKLTQSRQIFFNHKDKILIASCIDKTELFQMTSNMCNQLLNGLNWN